MADDQVDALVYAYRGITGTSDLIDDLQVSLAKAVNLPESILMGGSKEGEWFMNPSAGTPWSSYLVMPRQYPSSIALDARDEGRCPTLRELDRG